MPATRLTAQAIDRILRAAHGWPADQRPSDLGRELLRAISHYNFLRTLSPDVKAHWACLKSIHKHASALESALVADERKGGMFNKNWPHDMPSPTEIVLKIRQLVEESGWLEASPRNIVADTKADLAASGSAFEWLVGKKLPELFEQFFRAEPTLYRKGRYPDFALQVLTEFQITNDGRPYSRESIIKAITDARSGRSRRRARQK
jgi:hypothetical protein